MEEWYRNRREIRERRDLLRPKLAQFFNAVRSYFSHLEKDPLTDQQPFTVDHPHPDTLVVRPFFDGPELTIDLPTDDSTIVFSYANMTMRVIDIHKSETGHDLSVRVEDPGGAKRDAALKDILQGYADRVLAQSRVARDGSV